MNAQASKRELTGSLSPTCSPHLVHLEDKVVMLIYSQPRCGMNKKVISVPSWGRRCTYDSDGMSVAIVEMTESLCEEERGRCRLRQCIIIRDTNGRSTKLQSWMWIW